MDSWGLVRATLVIVALAVSAFTRSAVAAPPDPPPAHLVVRRDDTASICPDADFLASRVNEITGWKALELTSSATTRLTLEVQLVGGKAGYSAQIRASGSRTGTRRIADIGNECVGLADALAVTLAIIMDDERTAPADGIPPPAEKPPRPLPTPREDRGAKEPSAVLLRPYATGVLTLGVLEDPAFGPSVGLSVALEQVALGLEVLWLPPRTFQRSPGDAEVSLLAANAFGCWRAVDDQAGYMALCGHLAAGRLHGAASGYDENRTRSRPWFAPGLGILGGGPVVGPLEWLAQAKVFVPANRERFVIDNVGSVHETPPIGGMLGIGLAIAIH